MKYQHTASGTIFHTWDQERLWLAKNADAACVEGSEFHLAKRAEYGIVEYVEPVYTPTLAEAKTNAVTTIKQTRINTLDLYPKRSVGVSMIYAANVSAAIRFQNNDTTILPTGQTPEVYLGTLGVELGMTAAQFAAYIISENLRLGAEGQTPPSACDVECHYLRASVAAQAAATVEAVQTIVDDYISFCSTVTGQ